MSKYPQVLLLGNGINISNGCETWAQFLESIKDDGFDMELKDLKSPMPLQAILVSGNKLDVKLKEKSKELLPVGDLIDKNVAVKDILSLDFDEILTTNYTYELEQVANDNKPLSMYKLKKMNKHAPGTKTDMKYTINSYNEVAVGCGQRRIWHIHGEARKPGSMVLGHYYYGRVVKKIIDFVTDRHDSYSSDQKNGKDFVASSWIDSFIMGDVYILGFGFDFSELDLWWLLNRKYNEKANHGNVYFYEPKKESQIEKVKLLNLLGVKVEFLGFKDEEKDDKETADYVGFYKKALSDIKEKIEKNKPAEE